MLLATEGAVFSDAVVPATIRIMKQRMKDRIRSWVTVHYRWIFWGVLMIIVGGAASLLFVAAAETPDETMRVAFLDVGQGDAVFVEAPNGNQVLIDGGPSRAVLRGLADQMWFWDRSIDVLIATHPDKDHIGGLVDVLDAYGVDAVLRSGARSKSGAFRAFRRSTQEEGARTHRLHAGQTVRLSPRVHFDVLFPPKSAGVRDMEQNKASVTGRLVYGDTAVLLSGDAPKEVEQYLARKYAGNLESEVLKVGHHGSDTSTAEPWLGWSDPEYAVISAGKDNPHGHPHESVTERLKRFETKVLQTKKRGTVVFESDGERIKLIE